MNRSTHTKHMAFDYFNVLLTLGMMLIMIYPLWYITVGAWNDGMDYMRGGVFFFPRQPTTENFRAVFINPAILNAFLITIAKCVVATAGALLVTGLASYAIIRPNLRFKKFYLVYIMTTMFFGGGLIPFFLLITQLRLYDTFWVYVLPNLFGAYNMVIMQSFMRDISPSLIESAKIDGAGEYRVFFQIILPLSKPVLATIALFSIVGHWNGYFDSMMYTHSAWLETIQLYLKKVITDPSARGGLGGTAATIPGQMIRTTPQSVKLATMVVTALPIVLVYPFLQRYFVKGITIGAVKG